MDSATLISNSVRPLYRLLKSSISIPVLHISLQWDRIAENEGFENGLPVRILTPLWSRTLDSFVWIVEPTYTSWQLGQVYP